MATIKSHTSLEQSKKLAEILSIESADMSYYIWKDDGHLMSPVPFVLDGMEEKEDGIFKYIPCWSLTALLDVLPPIEGFRPIIDLDINLIRYEGNYRDELCFYENNLVDACVEMIEKLNELNLL